MSWILSVCRKSCITSFRIFAQALPEYDGIGVGRDDGKTAGEYAPLFYRKDKYEVLDSNTFWLAENPDSVGMMGMGCGLCPYRHLGEI